MTGEFFNTLSLAKRLYDKTMQPVCDRFQVSRMELDILLFLANHPAYDTAKDMIERRRVTKSHVSTSVGALEARGYLKRMHWEQNKKTIHIQLCPEADDVITMGQKAQKDFFEAILKGVPSKTIDEMEKGFRLIADQIRTALSEGE